MASLGRQPEPTAAACTRRRLASEACGAHRPVHAPPELLGLDILVDLAYWAVGWTDWNLVLDVSGGPNHLKNLCDANIIVDVDNQTGHGQPLIMQASYYYMGHFSRYLPPGSRRVGLSNSVEAEDRPLDPSDVKNGQAMLFAPCDGGDIQKWTYDTAHDVRARPRPPAALPSAWTVLLSSLLLSSSRQGVRPPPRPRPPLTC